MTRAALSLALVAALPVLAQTRYDVALQGGRVVDPETGLDAIRNVGIQGGRVARISALFNPGWRERLGVQYSDLQMVDTGERLTAESFERYHRAPEQRLVIIHTNPDELVDAVMLHPLTIVASDGHIVRGKGHPRGAGTYARVLSRYVRAQGRLSLLDAIRKAALAPAQRLEGVAMGRKGRLQEGADADIAVFDAATVQDRSSYERPAEPSVGFRYVLVAGTPVVDGGKLVEGVFPGKALVRRQVNVEPDPPRGSPSPAR